MKIFISHCSEDGKVIEKLVSIWKACSSDITLFYSSNPETGVAAGDGLLNRINGEIEQCDYFVPIITENYVRKLILYLRAKRGYVFAEQSVQKSSYLLRC